jgi:hypothetical protein
VYDECDGKNQRWSGQVVAAQPAFLFFQSEVAAAGATACLNIPWCEKHLFRGPNITPRSPALKQPSFPVAGRVLECRISWPQRSCCGNSANIAEFPMENLEKTWNLPRG